MGITLRITEFSDFFHHPVFEQLENTMFGELDLFLASGGGEGEEDTSFGSLNQR
jgi:hypothetical protein